MGQHIYIRLNNWNGYRYVSVLVDNLKLVIMIVQPCGETLVCRYEDGSEKTYTSYELLQPSSEYYNHMSNTDLNHILFSYEISTESLYKLTEEYDSILGRFYAFNNLVMEDEIKTFCRAIFDRFILQEFKLILFISFYCMYYHRDEYNSCSKCPIGKLIGCDGTHNAEVKMHPIFTADYDKLKEAARVICDEWGFEVPYNNPLQKQYEMLTDYASLYKLEAKLDELTESQDNVNHPNHYETGKYECIDVMIETQGIDAVKDFCICNAFKYIYRHKNKNGIEDVKKAIRYLNKYVELSERTEDEI